MDLMVDCPHCAAKIGELCTKECTVNGKKIIALEKALWVIDLSFDNISIPKEEVE